MAKKQIIETPECRAFADTMNEAEAREYAHLLYDLSENGRLAYPDAEVVETGLFALRVRVGGMRISSIATMTAQLCGF